MENRALSSGRCRTLQFPQETSSRRKKLEEDKGEEKQFRENGDFSSKIMLVILQIFRISIPNYDVVQILY